MVFRNPVVAGTVLVRTAIQSVDYVAGVSGWAIFRNGNLEVNNGTFRGTVIAGGGTVTLSSTGLHIEGAGKQYDINTAAGIIARVLPSDGSAVAINPNQIALSPQSPSPVGTVVSPAIIDTSFVNPGVAAETVYTRIFGAAYTAKSAPDIFLYGQANNDANPDDTSHIDMFAEDINLFVGTTQPAYFRGEQGGFLLSFGPAPSANIAVTYAKTYTNPPFPYANIDSGAGATSLCVARCTQRTNTGFNILIFSTDGTNRTFVNIPISWDVVE